MKTGTAAEPTENDSLLACLVFYDLLPKYGMVNFRPGSPTTIINQENVLQFGQSDRGNSSTKDTDSQKI